jgi:hypothetical protein
MMGRKRLLGAVLLLIAAVLVTFGIIDVGCEGPTSVVTVTGPGVPISASAPAAPAVPPRRPTRRYFFARTEARCDVYAVDGAQTTAPEAFPCPGDLNPGERIRIVGKTCSRESPVPEREEPVPCPDPLTNREKADIAREHPPK